MAGSSWPSMQSTCARQTCATSGSSTPGTTGSAQTSSPPAPMPGTAGRGMLPSSCSSTAPLTSCSASSSCRRWPPAASTCRWAPPRGISPSCRGRRPTLARRRLRVHRRGAASALGSLASSSPTTPMTPTARSCFGSWGAGPADCAPSGSCTDAPTVRRSATRPSPSVHGARTLRRIASGSPCSQAPSSSSGARPSSGSCRRRPSSSWRPGRSSSPRWSRTGGTRRGWTSCKGHRRGGSGRSFSLWEAECGPSKMPFSVPPSRLRAPAHGAPAGGEGPLNEQARSGGPSR
mmetsp:Transcript_65610/g.203279  ORF Transcript_65610/g.203279 Transcript_65610/m.203279 type:complete len:290 (-) Transcript_65610:26-895(-)